MAKRKGKTVAYMIAACLLGMVTMVGCLGWLQEQLIFFPEQLDQDADLSWTGASEEVFIDTDDGARIHGLLFEASEPARGVVLYFHGNAGSVASWYQVATQLVRHDVDVLLIDYRTYGKSEGNLSEKGLYRDGDAAYEYLRSRDYEPSSIVVHGRSLGTAVATRVATEHAVGAMVLETPFTNLPDLAVDLYPFPFPRRILRYSLDNQRRAGDIDVPTWVVHGTHDEVVPLDHGRAVFEALKQGWAMTIIEGGTHNDLMSSSKYHRHLARFFDETLTPVDNGDEVTEDDERDKLAP